MDSKLFLLFGLFVGALVVWWVPRLYRRARLGARFARSRRLEEEAARVLAGAGYVVIAAQITAPCVVLQDGKPIEADLRADYLVTRRGRVFVAEAKSGLRATDLRDRGTRRQLLEYAITYEVDGVLLVDMESERVVEVGFPTLGRRSARGFWAGLAVGAAGVALAWAAA